MAQFQNIKKASKHKFTSFTLEQGMRESNSHQRFWRPLSYHLTNPLYIFRAIVSNDCLISLQCNVQNVNIYFNIFSKFIAIFKFLYLIATFYTTSYTLLNPYTHRIINYPSHHPRSKLFPLLSNTPTLSVLSYLTHLSASK